MLSLRFALAACLLGAAVSPATSFAQTTLKLTYPGSATPCVFVSDAQGVRLDPATGELLATGDFGSGCPSGAVASPSFTNNLVSGDDTTGPITLGAGVILKWAADADACTYTGTFPEVVTGWPSSGAACSSGATCSTTHTFNYTPTTAGTYTFGLQCTKTGNATPVTSTATILVNPVSTSDTQCTGTASTLSRQTIGRSLWLGSFLSINANDVTQFQNVWGRDQNDPNNTSTIVAWPDRSGSLVQSSVNKNQYLSLKFVVPPNLPSSSFGTYQGSSTVSGATPSKFSMTISHSCYGEFDTSSSNLPNAFCTSSDQTEAGGITWTLSTNPNSQTTCKLTPGETYYLNVVSAPLTSSDATSGTVSRCTSSSCAASINNSWQVQ